MTESRSLSRRSGSRATVLLLTCLSLVYGGYVIRKYQPFTFAYFDPGWMIRTVMSIAEDGDLDLRNQLDNNPDRTAGQTSQGVNGQWYPLHEYLMPLATLPFYLLLGINGCLVFNVVIVILLMLTLFHLCKRHVDTRSAFTAVVLTAFATLFLDYTYSYSLDVFGAFVLVIAYSLVVRRQFMLAGFAWALAVYARLSNVVTVVGFLPFVLTITWRIRGSAGSGPFFRRLLRWQTPLIRFIVGGVPVALCFLSANWVMFGSPFLTSYSRWQHFVNGRLTLSTQASAFGCSLIEQLPRVLLDTRSGLLVGGPLIIIAAIYGIRAFWNEARDEAILMLLTCSSMIVLYSKYCLGYPGSPGNRYLMSVVALSAIPLSMLLRDAFRDGDTPCSPG